MKTKTNNVKTLAEFKDEFYGKTGTEKRDNLEKGYEHFKLGALIHEARIEKGLTQEELVWAINRIPDYYETDKEKYLKYKV